MTELQASHILKHGSMHPVPTMPTFNLAALLLCFLVSFSFQLNRTMKLMYKNPAHHNDTKSSLFSCNRHSIIHLIYTHSVTNGTIAMRIAYGRCFMQNNAQLLFNPPTVYVYGCIRTYMHMYLYQLFIINFLHNT